MLKIITCFVLYFILSPCFAENWVFVAGSKRNMNYVDTSSIKKNGNVRRAWVVRDILDVDADIKSFRALQDFDCKESKLRVLRITGYSENMLQGLVAFTSNEAEKNWKYTSPGSIDDTLIDFVCK